MNTHDVRTLVMYDCSVYFGRCSYAPARTWSKAYATIMYFMM